MMKMLLLARGDLTDSLSQPAIAALDKSLYWQTASQLFRGLLAKGFLLLNASLVYEEGRVSYHAKQWRPFIRSILEQLNLINPSIELLLFGKIAHQIPGIDEMRCLIAEHPYNLSFIQNPHVLEWFKPLDLLRAHDL